jgi:hypothetical protein
LALLAVAAFAACDDDESGGTATVVHAADALTAAVTWQADEQEPVLDDNGEAQLPVIFVVAGDGAKIDVGVQAEVAEALVDIATLRFADEPGETFDAALEGEPVRDEGVLLIIGPMPEAARTVSLEIDRYDTIDEWESLQLQITAAPSTDDGAPPTPRASVTSVTQL